jgi:NitT/TauT family transport system permease protein
LPQALPQVMAGIRTSVSVALLVSVTAEMLLSTDGLGVFLRRSKESFQMADGLSGIALLAVCAFMINRLNVWCEKKLLFWHSSRMSGNDNA